MCVSVGEGGGAREMLLPHLYASKCPGPCPSKTYPIKFHVPYVAWVAPLLPITPAGGRN